LPFAGAQPSFGRFTLPFRTHHGVPAALPYAAPLGPAAVNHEVRSFAGETPPQGVSRCHSGPITMRLRRLSIHITMHAANRPAPLRFYASSPALIMTAMLSLIHSTTGFYTFPSIFLFFSSCLCRPSDFTWALFTHPSSGCVIPWQTRLFVGEVSQ